MCRIFLFLMPAIVLHIGYLGLCFHVLSSPHVVAEYIGEIPVWEIIGLLPIFLKSFLSVYTDMLKCNYLPVNKS